MNNADESIYAAIQEVQRLRTRTKKKKTLQVKGAERDIIRATALAWFNNHRKQLTVVFTKSDLADIDKLYQWTFQASHKTTLRSSYVDVFKQIADALVEFRSSNVIRLSEASFAPPTSDTLPDFSSIVSDDLMKKILEDRWTEIAACVTAKTPLAATVMMGGLLEGVLYARIDKLADKKPVFTAAAAPKDKLGKTQPLREWTLQNYIDVAHEIGWITQTVHDISDVVRDYRNYIHPHKQHSEKMFVSPEDAKILWEISKSIARQTLTP
ncbi:MAG: hypothetical protein WBF54_02115 [Terriglobales bacterium]